MKKLQEKEPIILSRGEFRNFAIDYCGLDEDFKPKAAILWFKGKAIMTKAYYEKTT